MIWFGKSCIKFRKNFINLIKLVTELECMAGALLWLFFPAWDPVPTLKVGFICLFVVIDPTYLGTTWSKIRPVDLLLHRQYVPLCNMPAFLLLLFSCTAIWKHVCRNVQVGNSIELDKVGHQFKTCLGAGESFSSVLELNQCCQTPWDGVQQPFFVTKCHKGTKSL